MFHSPDDVAVKAYCAVRVSNGASEWFTSESSSNTFDSRPYLYSVPLKMTRSNSSPGLRALFLSMRSPLASRSPLRNTVSVPFHTVTSIHICLLKKTDVGRLCPVLSLVTLTPIRRVSPVPPPAGGISSIEAEFLDRK